MTVGWAGAKVRLVPLDRARHLDNALTWLNDPEVTAWTLVGDWPLGRLAEEAFFDGLLRQDPHAPPADIVFAVEALGGEHIGFTGLHRIDWRNGVALTGTVIGRRDLWGSGLGTDTVRVRSAYAFTVLGLRLLLSEVFADNRASLHMLARTGYREVGRIPGRYFKGGSFRDVVLLAFARGEWHAGAEVAPSGLASDGPR